MDILLLANSQLQDFNTSGHGSNVRATGRCYPNILALHNVRRPPTAVVYKLLKYGAA